MCKGGGGERDKNLNINFFAKNLPKSVLAYFTVIIKCNFA